MTEETYRKWDIGIKIVAPIITIIGLLVGIWQFSKDRAAQLERQYALIHETDRIQFKNRLWEKQLDTYVKISSVAGQIAVVKPGSNELKKAIDQFHSLYFSDAIYFQDDDVRQAMIDLRLEIHDYLERIGTLDKLRKRAISVLKTLQESSGKALFIQPH